MLTRILHPPEQLCTFVHSLGLRLSQPQLRHLIRLADALLVWEGPKTLTALQRQFVQAPDPSNWADFLRISPWSASEVRAAARARQVAWLIAEAERAGAPRVIYINLDDSLGEKDKDTRHIEPVSWFFDHTDNTYKNGFCYILCTMRVGNQVATVDVRLYLREKTVRRLNRYRPPERRLHFRSKYRIARQILAELAPLLPKGWKVYVQFDSWYASRRLIRFIRRQGWHGTFGLKSNRKLDGQTLTAHAQALRHRWYARVRVTTTDGDEQTYYVRRLEGRLAGLSDPVRVYVSKRHPREKFPAYIGCTDCTCTAKEALQGYAWRWSCETVNFYLKTQAGLADFRVQSYEAVERYIVVVFLAWAYVEWRFARERSAQVQTYGDILRRHQEEHAEDWLRGVVEMAIETREVEAVLRHFLRREA